MPLYRVQMSMEQIRVGGDNFGYVIYCERSNEAALVDPGMDASKALRFIELKKLKLLYIINTHHHGDHCAENSRVKRILGCQIVASEVDAPGIPGGTDMTVSEGDDILLGDVSMRFIITPGHTPGGLCIIVDDRTILTGDTLFISDCGRTDLPGGSDRQMYRTIQRLKTLPDELMVYPGHDYGSVPSDTLGNLKRDNVVLLAGSLEEFLKIP